MSFEPTVLAIGCRFLFHSLRSAIVLILLFPGTLFGEAPDQLTEGQSFPVPCSGYNPDTNTWGWNTTWEVPRVQCADNHVYFGCDPSHGLGGNCCPLPRSDILSNEHMEATNVCPDSFVVTGVRGVVAGCGDDYKRCDHVLRCTKINTKRYTLGPMKRGVMWGFNSSSAFPWKEEKFIRRDEIPPAIRYGIARIRRSHFHYHGCVGSPIGSLLVGRSGYKCMDTRWRRLQEISEGGNTPVQMYPECKSLDKIYSNKPVCRK